MIKDGKVSGLALMIIVFIGIVIVIWAFTWLVLSRFKSDKTKGLKYELSLTICTIILIDSYYIKFFTTQILENMFMEYTPIILMIFASALIPYNLITSLICGVRGKKLILTTLSGSIVTGLVFIVATGF